MVVKANKTHIGLIVKRLGEFQKVSADVVESLLDDQHEVIYIDETLELVCRIKVKENENQVVWLLPANAQFIDLYHLMSLALIDIYKNFPYARYNKTWARFASGRGCASVYKADVAKELANAWHTLFPNSSQVKHRLWDNSWIIYGNHQEIVEEILSNHKRTTYGNSYSYL